MSRSPAQTEALQQLWAITASETDAARARDERILRENNWDIQVGILWLSLPVPPTMS